MNCIFFVIMKFSQLPNSAFVIASWTFSAFSFVLSILRLLYMILFPFVDVMVLRVGTRIKVSVSMFFS